MLHASLGALLLGAACAAGGQTAPATTQTPRVSAQNAPVASARPAWAELTPAQRDALSPLAGQWESLGAEQKQKWLGVAAKYPKLTPDAQKRVQQRMGEFARLTPEQRVTARENFRRAYELPANERQERLQKYQDLPDDKKRALSEQAAKKKAAQSPPASPTPGPAPAPSK